MKYDPALLDEIREALDMPASGALAWVAHMRRFYDRHGGARRYAECLTLVEALQASLERPRK